jgi:hypothetical protein
MSSERLQCCRCSVCRQAQCQLSISQSEFSLLTEGSTPHSCYTQRMNQVYVHAHAQSPYSEPAKLTDCIVYARCLLHSTFS